MRPGNLTAASEASAYRDTSYWLETCQDDLTPRSALSGQVAVDVAVLGGGFSGLWTAYYLLRDNPGLQVAILEKDICGYGASGRNGGWCSSRYPLDAGTLADRYGVEIGRKTLQAMYDAVEEVGRVCEREGIDAEYRQTGILSLARGKAQLPAIQAAHRAYERLGFGEQNRLLSAEAARAKVNATEVEGALHSPKSATVHPAKLVRGLAQAVERLGGVIYERSPVTRFEPSQSPRLHTDSGVLVARKAIVAAGEAYLTQQPRYRRTLLPMSSLIVLTEPLSPAQWASVGWADGEGLGSQVNMVDYFTKTTDGRILYGSRGAPYHMHSNLDQPWDAATARTMRETLIEWFPSLEGIGFTHSWAGYLGVSRDWTPTISFDPNTKVGQLFGYTGRGVSTTNISARILAGMITGKPTGLEFLPSVGNRSPQWEPEPLRWLGVRYVQEGFARMDAAMKARKAAPIDAALVRRLSKQ
ncbi:NAD(P)/FAD-dependent oxidoreductase [Caulobacter sp. RL271]|uniref:FAD-binding oxidoreductase n=1 Tax=Caulobacter segnis TaxID=88688 RepID=A0ABY4ZRQ4_9CAUL|nr:FAD-dependent oxidoreductase [Caulobacter segnis]USQ95492.1 FAD-binding oxidoreductase [Caulobacter segnis]